MIIDLSGVTFMDSAGIGLIKGRMDRVSSVEENKYKKSKA